MNWKEQLRLYPELRDMNNWPAFDVKSLEPEQRSVYRARHQAVMLVLSGSTLSEAGHAAGLSASQVSRILSRALGGQSRCPDPALTQALIPYQHVRSSLPTKVDSNRVNQGFRGQFNRLLHDHPEIIDLVDEVIRRSQRHDPAARHLPIVDVHAKLIRHLRQKGFTESDYPLNTETHGRESFRRFYNKRRRALMDHKFEARSKRHLNGGAIDPSYHQVGSVEFDHHLLDAESSVQIDDGIRRTLKLLQIPRFWLGLVVEKSSNAILGYSFDFGKTPGQYSVLHCLDMLQRGREAFDQGLIAVEDPLPPALPMDFYPELKLIPREIRLDNAWAHFSNLVCSVSIDQFAATLVHGHPAIPLARQLVESTFKKLERYIHTFPSTTGTNVLDPRRPKRRVGDEPPLITVPALIEVIHRLVSEHNLRSMQSLDGLSPVEYLRRSMDDGSLCPVFDASLSLKSPFERSVTRQVKLYDGLSPHINMLYTRYRGSCLKPSMVGRKVLVRYSVLDVRYAEAFTVDGRHLGSLSVPARWMNIAHDEYTRQQAAKYARREHLLRGDPIGPFLEHLLEREDVDAVRQVIRLSHAIGRKGGTNGQTLEKSLTDQKELANLPSPIEWRPRT